MGEWQWYSIMTTVNSTGTFTIYLDGTTDSTHSADYFAPVFIRIPAASALPANELADLAQNLASYRSDSVAGQASLLPGEQFFADSISMNTGYLSETWTVGSGGVTANTLVQTDSSAPSKIVTATTGVYGIAQSTAASGTVQVARYGTIPCITDTGGATAGDLVIIGTGTVSYCKDSGQTSSSAISTTARIVGVFRSTAVAAATALVELTPAHFGTNISSPLTTEGDLYYYHSGANARLPLGANGTCVTSNGTTAVWGSCAGSGFMVNPMTTAGDIIYGGASGTPTRLAIGTAPQFLGINAGVPAWSSLAIPGPIGGSTPNTGAFTTLSASSTVSGAGFSTYLASPPAIGGTAAAAGHFTSLAATLQFTSTLATGTAPFSIASTTVVPNLNVSQLLGNTWAIPGTIGSTTPNTGAFTNLSSSGAVSGSGFSAYLASPPAIGGLTPAAGTFTALVTNTSLSGTGVNNLFASPPAIGSTAPAAGTFTTLLATGIFDGKAPVTITTTSSAPLGGTYNGGYTFNQNATPATAITYTLPVAAAGKQYCVANSDVAGTADTGAITLATSGTGQYIHYNGARSGSGGFIVSAGAAGDKACVVGITAVDWEFYPQFGVWSLH